MATLTASELQILRIKNRKKQTEKEQTHKIKKLQSIQSNNDAKLSIPPSTPIVPIQTWVTHIQEEKNKKELQDKIKIEIEKEEKIEKKNISDDKFNKFMKHWLYHHMNAIYKYNLHIYTNKIIYESPLSGPDIYISNCDVIDILEPDDVESDNDEYDDNDDY